MTSTNVFTGMGTERNSSRVLKPPGGGHTDILGVTSQPESSPVKKVRSGNTSSNIMNISENKSAPSEKVAQQSQPKSETPTVKESSTNSNQASRGRVPPGGFSSGLW